MHRLDKIRILVVEDNDDLREMVATLLDVHGAEVTCAPDGQAALKLLRGAPLLPHLILLDYRMPVMSGGDFLLARREESALAEIPVILVTAVPEETLHFDAALRLKKPVASGTLVASIIRVLADPARRPAG